MLTQLDNYTFQDFGLIEEFGHVHPSTPEFSDKTISIPGRIGVLSFGTEIRAKQFTFPLKVFVRNRTERQRRKNNFVAFLFDEYMRPREFKLRFPYEPEKFYKVKISNQITPEMLVVLDQFELVLVANDPVKYAEMTYSDTEIVKQLGMSDELKKLMNQPYADQTHAVFRSTSRKIGIYNYSPFRTPFGFIASGNFSNLKIRNETTGKEMSVDGTFSDGDKLYINGKDYTAYLERPSARKYFFLSSGQIIKAPSKWTEVNLFANKQGDFFDLKPGGNIITFESASVASSYIQYDWLHRFI